MAASLSTKHSDPTIGKLKEILILVGRHDLPAAEAQARMLQNDQPDRAEVNNILGMVLVSRNNPVAIRYLDLAARKEPRNVIYLNNLGRAYLGFGLIEYALAPLNKALAINPKLMETQLLLAEYYRATGKPDLALPYQENVCRREPDNPAYKWALGKTFEMLRRAEEARACFFSLKDHPDIGNVALYRLAVNDQHELSSPLLAEIEARLGSDQIAKRARSALHVAAGKIYEHNRDYASAFAHFWRANESDAMPFDLANYRRWVDALISVFTPEVFVRRRGKGSTSDIPVFVLGMPRSGTTLTDQIIARHPQAARAGELARMRKIARSLHYCDDVARVLPAFDAMSQAKSTALGDEYVNLLKVFAPEARRVVDKMPHNFELLGLIALLCPEAYVVHMRRNAIDTCLSCYQNQLSNWHGYSRDLATLGLYYREYSRLMDHWRRVLPLKFLDVDYEKLTDDFETEARRLITFLDLPWDPACLSFHESTAAVGTFSRNQVRSPIYRSSVGRWRHYEQQVQPLIAALGDIAGSLAKSH